MASFDINELIDKPYTEMTLDEIEYVIEYKAEKKAKEATYQKMLEESQAAQKAMIETNAETARIALEALGDLKDRALARLEEAGKADA